LRNLKEYPITWEEKRKALKEAKDMIAEKYRNHFGSITEVAIDEISEDLFRLEELEH
jgi:hypothetical protein